MQLEKQEELKTFFQGLWRRHIDRSNRIEKWKTLSSRGTALFGGDSIDDGYDSHDSVTQNILTSYIFPAMDDQLVNEIKSRIAFGLINNPEVNAKIITVDGVHFAVLLSHGILSYYRDWLRLLWAVDDPKSVIYCDGVDIAQADSSTYARLLKNTIDSYKDIGVPMGPGIHLDEKGHVSCGIHQTLILIFLIGHELGHFLNGDFQLAGVFHKSSLVSTISEFNIAGRHELELRADLVGFDILQRTKEHFFTEDAPVGEGIEFFILHRLLMGLHFISPKEGSHPSPISRILNIADSYDERTFPTEFKDIVTRLRKDHQIGKI